MERPGRKGILHTFHILWLTEDCLVRVEKGAGSAIWDTGSWIFVNVQ